MNTDPIALLNVYWHQNPLHAINLFFEMQSEELKFFFCDKIDQVPQERNMRIHVLSQLATVFAGDSNYKPEYNRVCYLIREALRRQI